MYLAGISGIIPAGCTKASNQRALASSDESDIEPLVKDFRRQWNQLVQSRTPEMPKRKKQRQMKVA